MDTKARFGPSDESLLLWRPLINPSAKVDFTSFSLFLFKYTSVSKIEGIIFGRDDLFSLSRYFYFRKEK